MLLKKYSPEWVNDFNALKKEIEIALTDIVYTIEHVGSTAVPHLDAKPIIDIDIVYDEQSDFELIKSRLESIGYYHNGNQGIEDREVFKRINNGGHVVLDGIQHHLYVCPKNSKALERHLLSRDFLRKNDWARIKYQAMKYELAEKAHQDRKIYAALKELHVNDFIDWMIEKEKQNT
jgi:GrpB-like predicted nucleotidyltransferase (UPF0157 family)